MAPHLRPPLLSALLRNLVARARHPIPHSGKQLTSGYSQRFLGSWVSVLSWVRMG